MHWKKKKINKDLSYAQKFSKRSSPNIRPQNYLAFLDESERIHGFHKSTVALKTRDCSQCSCLFT